jgi:hypothetical protein
MAVLELARFKVGIGKAEAMVSSRDDMMAAMRARFPGLIEARLARLDEETWIDVWRWDTLENAQPPPRVHLPSRRQPLCSR